MYKQPENNNRVKYMKNRFEKLDSEKNNQNDIKIAKINNKTNDKNMNNNDYKTKIKENVLVNEENVEIKTGPPLNLTRQLSDPSKKGCIKRTPAFRKEKFVNSRLKTNELSFEGKINLFEYNDADCDIKERKLTSSASLVLSRPQNIAQKRTSLSPKRLTNQKILTKNMSTLYNLNTDKIKIPGKKVSVSSVGSSNPDIVSPKANSSFLSTFKTSPEFKTSKFQKNENKSPVLGKTFSPKLDSSNVKNSQSVKNNLNEAKTSPNILTQLRKAKENPEHRKSLIKNISSPKENKKVLPSMEPNLKLSSDSKSPISSPESPVKKNVAVKIREKNKSEKLNDFATTRKTSVSFIKEMLENQQNDDFEQKLDKLPEYAQVNKTRKKQDENLTDTLKAALKQPLPVGPPPKKPPRTFTHVTNTENEVQKKIESPTKESVQKICLDAQFSEKLTQNLNEGPKKLEDGTKKVKSDPKLMLQKLENALLNNKIRSPKLPKKIKSSFESKTSNLLNPSTSNNYTTEPNLHTPIKAIFPCLSSLNCTNVRQSYSQVPTLDSKSTFFVEKKEEAIKKEEPIYAEPFEFQVREKSSCDDAKTSTISRSVHYLSSPVSSQPWTEESADSSDKGINDINQSDVKCGNSAETLNKHKLRLIMNHTYASLTPSDSDDMDSNTSTPTFESPPSPARRNAIRELIATYEKQLKETEAFRIPPDVRQRLTRQSSVNNPEAAKKMLNRQFSAELNIREKEDESKDLAQDGDTVDYYSIQKKKVKAELTRTLTEIRKNYVRRVCSTVKKDKDRELDESPHLFECCLLVELNMSTRAPYVKEKYPANYEVPPWVEHLCYPDASEWTPEVPANQYAQNCQNYSLVITNEKGERKFGYCRRVMPEEASLCLPLTYCIISTFRAPGFYYKVLQQLESRHGLPHWLQNAFLREVYNSKFPKPGQSCKITCLLRVLLQNSCNKLHENHKNVQRIETSNDRTVVDKNEIEEFNTEVQNDIYAILNELKLNKNELTKIDNYVQEFQGNSLRTNGNENIVSNSKIQSSDTTDFDNSCSLMLHLPNSQLIHDCLLGDIVFRRPYDHRIEDTDLTVLFETLKLDVLLQTFGSLLLERKVVLVSKCLSQVSSCVEAMQSILYPFSWQHTFIPVLSSNMLDILSAPLPLVAGVLAPHLEEELILEDGIAVNLDNSTIICSVGDEPGILPKRLRSGLALALQLVTSASTVDGSRNVLVSEAFIRMFVEVCGHYRQFIITNDKGEKVFDKDGFIKQQTSKSAQMFLEWFSETAMFHTFIQSQIDHTYVDEDNIFEQRCIELQNEKPKNKGMKKVKNFFKT